MTRMEIPFDKFSTPVFKSWGSDWFLLTSGSFKTGQFNTMTVAWGSFGVMWQKPFAMVVVRPSRHTYGFMEQFDTFTLCAFPAELKKVLSFCGVKSGKDVDKIKEAEITPISSLKVEAPGFDEAELIIECRKNYFDDFRPKHFMDSTIEGNYPGRDYHRVYFGEIVAINGAEKYLDEK